MKGELNWKKGEPAFEGLHLVAVRYPSGLGELDLYNWNDGWFAFPDDQPIPASYRVVGHATLTDMMAHFGGNWPSWDDED